MRNFKGLTPPPDDDDELCCDFFCSVSREKRGNTTPVPRLNICFNPLKVLIRGDSLLIVFISRIICLP